MKPKSIFKSSNLSGMKFLKTYPAFHISMNFLGGDGTGRIFDPEFIFRGELSHLLQRPPPTKKRLRTTDL